MGGIAGWADFEAIESSSLLPSPPRDRASSECGRINAMVGALAGAGWQTSGWTGSGVALAALHDSRSRRGHGCFEADDVPVVVAMSGNLSGAVGLRRRLQGLGHRFRGDSDGELAARGYLQWGEGVADALTGSFAIAVWDSARQELILIRDRLGIEPLYVHSVPGGVVFGSEPKAVLAHPACVPRVGTEGLREALAFVKTPGHAVFEGMEELIPGNVLRCHRLGSVARPYWSLEARPHEDDAAATATQVRQLLGAAVAGQLDRYAPTAFLLSGGLDSSALTMLAKAGLGADTEGLMQTYAVDFVGYASSFAPSEKRQTPDQLFVHALLAELDAPHEDILLDSAGLLERDLRSRVWRAIDLPTGMGDLDAALLSLFDAIRTRCSTIISGDYADETFGGYRWMHDPLVAQTPAFPWIARAVRAGAGNSYPEGILDLDLVHELDVPAYQARRYEEALAEVPVLPGEDGADRRKRELTYLAMTRWGRFFLDRRDRLARAAGVEARVPFADHTLAEYAFNIPWSVKTVDTMEKSVLRNAVADLLPDSVLNRRKSHFPQTMDDDYETILLKRLADVAAGNFPVESILRPGILDTLMAADTADAKARIEVRANAETILELNDWMCRYDLTVSP